MRLPPPNNPNGIPIKSLDLQLLWLEGKMNLWSNILCEGWKWCKCVFMALWGHLHTFQSCCSAQLSHLFSQNIKTNSKDNQCLPFHAYFNFFVWKKNFYQNINGLGKLFWVQNMIMKDICHKIDIYTGEDNISMMLFTTVFWITTCSCTEQWESRDL